MNVLQGGSESVVNSSVHYVVMVSYCEPENYMEVACGAMEFYEPTVEESMVRFNVILSPPGTVIVSHLVGDTIFDV